MKILPTKQINIRPSNIVIRVSYRVENPTKWVIAPLVRPIELIDQFFLLSKDIQKIYFQDYDVDDINENHGESGDSTPT